MLTGQGYNSLCRHLLCYLAGLNNKRTTHGEWLWKALTVILYTDTYVTHMHVTDAPTATYEMFMPTVMP